MSVLDDLQTINLPDVDMNVSDDGYVDPSNTPAPIPAGNYLLVAKGAGLHKDNDGKPIFPKRGNYPTVEIKRVEVLQPADYEGRAATTFERIYSVPFDRQGTTASGLADFTRAMDQTRTWRKLDEGVALAIELAESGTSFKARVDWEAYDKDHYDALCAKEGGESMLSPEQTKQFRKAATIKGMKKFPQNPDGSYQPFIVGPSGANIEARARITSYYPSAKDVKLG